MDELIERDSLEDIDDVTQLNKDCISLMIEMEANGWIVKKKGEIFIQQKELASRLFEFLTNIFKAVDEIGKHTKQEIIDNDIDEDGYEEYMQSSCMLYGTCLMLFGEFAKERLPVIYFKVRCVEKNDKYFELMHAIEESKRKVQQCMNLFSGVSNDESLSEADFDALLAELSSDDSKETDQDNSVVNDEKECSTPTSEYENNEEVLLN